jgi:hypothetical protein
MNLVNLSHLGLFRWSSVLVLVLSVLVLCVLLWCVLLWLK